MSFILQNPKVHDERLEVRFTVCYYLFPGSWRNYYTENRISVARLSLGENNVRIAVLVVGILGSLAAGVFGLIMWAGFSIAEDEIRKEFGVDVDRIAEVPVTPENQKSARILINGYYRARTSIWFVLAALPLGVLGSMLAFSGRGFASAAVLLVAALGPVPLMPPLLFILYFVFMIPLVIAGVLAFFVRPAPPPRDIDYGDY